jgi:DNA-binding transcriptional regulator/RsmH inhibitor MraZ
MDMLGDQWDAVGKSGGSMLLAGTFVRSIDEKFRVAIPKRFRDALVGNEQRDLFITRGTDQSLVLYTEQGLDALARRLEAASPTQQDVRAFWLSRSKSMPRAEFASLLRWCKWLDWNKSWS